MGLCMWVTEMSDTLRTRIAALAVAHEWSPDGTGEGQCECDARWFKTKEMWADHLADAVIRELQLTVLGDGIVVGVIHA